MADVTLSYKGSDILELSDSGSATLKTGGKYCEDDIELEYVKSGASGYTNNDFLDVTKPVGAVYSDATEITVALTIHTGITSISLPNATTVPTDFANGCTNLISFSAPNLTGISNGLVYKCTSLESSLFFPKLVVMSVAFRYCKAPIIVVGSINSTQSDLFSNNPNLTTVDVLGGDHLGNNPFRTCPNVSLLVLRSSSLMALTNSAKTNLTDAKFGSDKSGGTIYVPQVLISDYEANSSWADVLGANPNNQILSIEGSQYETHYADGTVIE